MLALAVAVTATSAGRRAAAQSPDELKAARELFQEAYKAEQDKRFTEALGKFQRVAKVKESAAVRYRIGSVLESLGRLREARDAFRELASAKSQLSSNERPIADSAEERAGALDKRIPHLVLRTEEGPPVGAIVTIDGVLTPVATAPRAIELDPGEHVVKASATGSRPFESRVSLSEGADVALVIPLDPPAPPPSRVSEPSSALASPPPSRGARSDTLAYVALGTGGALLVASVVVLVLREGDIRDVNKECPNGACPIRSRSRVEDMRSEAQLFGPLGVGVGVLGLAATGVGVYLLARPSESRLGSTTALSPPSNGLRVGARPVAGGLVVRLGGEF